MKFRDIITESRLAPLYHTMDADKMINVFENDIMIAKWEHRIPNIGNVKGNSFTRNPNLNWYDYISITVDQNKLAQTHKIIPLDGDYVFYSFIKGSHIILRDRIARRNRTISEEYVVGDIKNLHRYIIEIDLRYIGANSYTYRIYTICRAYSKKWNIPLKVKPEFMRSAIQMMRDNRYDP